MLLGVMGMGVDRSLQGVAGMDALCVANIGILPANHLTLL